MKRVGIIGVGLLGTAVAGRLLEGGFEVAGYDIRPEQVAALKSKGLRAADSVADAAAGAEAVFTILPSLESVEQVYLAAGGLTAQAEPGAVVLQMSTISPALARRLAAAVVAAGKQFLDCPISGTSNMVATGDCVLFVAGAAEALAACQPLFQAIATRTVRFDEPGQAMLAKLATNLLVALNSASLAEALVLAAKGGISPAKMLETLQGTAGSSRMMDIRGPLMVKGDYPPQMKLDLFLKDLGLMLEAAGELGVSLPITSVANDLFRATSEGGAAKEDLAVVMRELEKRAGISR